MRYRSSFTSFAYRDPLKKNTSWSHHTPCGILVPDLGSNPCPLQWKRSLDHWTTKEVLPIIKVPFVEKDTLSPLSCFCIFVSNQLTVFIWVYFWSAICSIDLCASFTNTILPWILYFYIVSLKAEWWKLSSFRLLWPHLPLCCPFVCVSMNS